jgi:putative component of membrane protein insertase Oxa1/YidC/SpoIIIJ protein YidD
VLGADRISRCHGFAALGGYDEAPEQDRFLDPVEGHDPPLPWLSRFGL